MRRITRLLMSEGSAFYQDRRDPSPASGQTEATRVQAQAALRNQDCAIRAGTAPAPHVLVVDDEPMFLELFAEILRPCGVVVSQANDGFQAVDLVRRDAAIALAILDWRMPLMSGEKVLDKLLALRPDLKVIVVSGDPPGAIARAFAGRKVEDFLQKPFRVESLLIAVQSALGLPFPVR